MNLKKILASLIIALMAININMAILVSKAANEDLTLIISKERYAYDFNGNGEYKSTGEKYFIGNSVDNNAPIFQILSQVDKNNQQITGKNYYCIYAGYSNTWNNYLTGNGILSSVTYTAEHSKDLNNKKQEEVSQYLTNNNYNQIMWLLDNMYVLDTSKTKEENLQNKRAVLTKAGLVYGTYEVETLDEPELITGYKYKKVDEYDDSFVEKGKKGYGYYEGDEFKMVELSDEQVETVQQAVIWYFTNHKEHQNESKSTYDVRKFPESWLNILLDDSSQSIELANTKNKGDNEIGKWEQEQASILYNHLIEAAERETQNGYTVSNSNPLTVENADRTIDTTTLSEKYIVGPITINEINNTPYNLNKMLINNEENEEAYISNSQGQKIEKSLNEIVGEEFYVTVPASAVQNETISITFQGNYKVNEKTLWVEDGEQPIIEVKPKEESFTLPIQATLTKENKEFDLALRKSIIGITDAEGNSKFIRNEKKYDATRNLTYNATDINTNKTATYNHRKDPVVVEKGDIIKYAITIYNEGEKIGYANEIVDQLPEGLKLKTDNYSYQEDTKTGEYKKEATENSKAVDYTFKYDETENKITFTNNDPQDLNPYQGGDTLDSITIEIECEVVQNPSTTTNTYLTNLAYISKEHDSVLNQDIVEETGIDRDSEPGTKPNKNKDDLNTTGDEYNGYKGKTDNNSVYDDTNNNNYYKGEQDDDDFEIVVVEPAKFDLALQKYISAVNGNTNSGRTEPTIDSSVLADGSKTTANYTLDKTPIKVQHGDFVTYTFVVYNEGEIDGYVDKITDNIPTGLEFVYKKVPEDGKTLIVVDSQGNSSEIEVDSETYSLVNNNSYWSIDKANENALATDSYNGEQTISITCDVAEFLGGNNTLLNAYDAEKDAQTEYKGDGLSKVSVSVVLRVSASNGNKTIIRNEAAITEAEDSNGNKQDQDSGLEDTDSKVNEWPGKDGDKNYQDDEDYDNIKLSTIDLALSKFIAAVSDDENIQKGEYLTANGDVGSKTNPYSRATKVDTTELRDNPEVHDATYYKDKTPVVVPVQSYVLYDIRVYNEGEVDCYAAEVKDYLPDYLDFVNCEFNDNYGWKVEGDGKTITTDILSYEKSNPNALKAFDKENDDGAGSGLDYRDLQVLCRVNQSAPTNQLMVNVSEITKYEDENGNDVPKDEDSTPNNKDEQHEDDDDYDNIIVKTFDLSLLKYVTTVYVTEDGKTQTIQTGNTGADTDIIPKVEIHRKKVDSTIVKFGYTIKVTNEGDIEGYAKEITDYVPAGLKFYPEDNEGWKDEGNNVISTRLLENTLLKPGESAEVTVIFRWINGSDNLGLKTNIAEISEDYNKDGIPDKDSTPDNKVQGEDDIDDAQVLLSVSTGITENIVQYMTFGGIILIVLGTGIFLIKKYVL